MERKDFEKLAIALLRAIKPEDLDAVLIVQPKRGAASQIPVETDGQDEKPAAPNIHQQLADSLRASIGRRPSHVMVSPQKLVLLLLNAASEANDRLASKHRKATMRVSELTKMVDDLQAERDAWMAKARGLESAEQAKPVEQTKQSTSSRMTVTDWAAAKTIDWSNMLRVDWPSNSPPHFSFAPNGQPVLSVSPDGLFTWADNAAELIAHMSDGATKAVLRDLWWARKHAGLPGQLQERITNLERQLREMTRSRDSYRAALDEWQEKTEWVQRACAPNELGQHRADVMHERLLRLQGIVDGWDARMAWARDGRFKLYIGTHLGEIVHREFDALQRSRDELSKRLADEQRLHIKVDGLQGAGTETLQRCLNAFRANRGTPVRMAGDDAIRVFQLAIQALDRPGELGEIVDHLRRHAAAVQSTSERLTNLFDRKTEG